MKTAIGLGAGSRGLRAERPRRHSPPPESPAGEGAVDAVDAAFDHQFVDPPALNAAKIVNAWVLRAPTAQAVPGSGRVSGAKTIVAYKKVALEQDLLMRAGPSLWLQRLVDCADGPDQVVERLAAVGRLHALWLEMGETFDYWPRMAIAACLHLHPGERLPELESQISDTKWCRKMLRPSAVDAAPTQRVLALWAWSYGNARELNLANVGLDDRHAERLRDPLLGMLELRAVMLENNRLSAAAEPHLIQLARLHPTLVKIALDHQIDGAVAKRPLSEILAHRAARDGVYLTDLPTLNLISLTINKSEIAWPLTLKLDNAASGALVLAALEQDGHRLPALLECRLRAAIRWGRGELVDSVAQIARRARRLRDLWIQVDGRSRPPDVQAVLGAGVDRLRELRRLRLSGFSWSTEALQALRDRVCGLPFLIALEIGATAALSDEQSAIVEELEGFLAVRNRLADPFGPGALQSEAYLATVSVRLGTELWATCAHALTEAEKQVRNPFVGFDYAKFATPEMMEPAEIRPAPPVRLSSLRRLQRLRRGSADA